MTNEERKFRSVIEKKLPFIANPSQFGLAQAIAHTLAAENPRLAIKRLTQAACEYVNPAHDNRRGDLSISIKPAPLESSYQEYSFIDGLGDENGFQQECVRVVSEWEERLGDTQYFVLRVSPNESREEMWRSLQDWFSDFVAKNPPRKIALARSYRTIERHFVIATLAAEKCRHDLVERFVRERYRGTSSRKPRRSRPRKKAADFVINARESRRYLKVLYQEIISTEPMVLGW